LMIFCARRRFKGAAFYYAKLSSQLCANRTVQWSAPFPRRVKYLAATPPLSRGTRAASIANNEKE
jgi:hypothetical protein